MSKQPIKRPLRQAAMLVALGLLIQVVTLGSPASPASFLVFVCAGAVLVVVGTARYVLALIRMRMPSS